MKFIDSHCHPQFSQYDADRDEVIKRALNSGVQMICVGTDYQMSVAAVELAAKYDGIWASVGLHPNDVNQESGVMDHESRIKEFEKLAKAEKVVAVGEVGLDYYRTKEPEKQKLQRNVLEQFIDLAVSKNKPLIIHCRDPLRRSVSKASAHADVLSVIENSALRGVIHSFTGTWQEAKRYIDLGFYIGLNGIITFTDQYNETVLNVSLENLLLETDAPYLTPEPLRGKRNEPAYVKHVAEKIAKLRKVDFTEIAKTTTQNAKKLFNINV